jgi:hypothetical protein
MPEEAHGHTAGPEPENARLDLQLAPSHGIRLIDGTAWNRAFPRYK